MDTSIARPFLLGPTKYRTYLASEISGKRYASSFVRMEFTRSFLCNAIAFYFVLDMPNISTVGDALALWANKFRSSEQKAILQLMSQVFQTRKVVFDDPTDKRVALRHLGILIKQLESNFRRKFTDPSKDTTHCGRATVPFDISLANMTQDFDNFLKAFNDKKKCRSLCKIDDFLLNRYKSTVDHYIDLAACVPENKDTKGFLSVARNLKDAVDSGGKACTCSKCEAYGDAIIALDAPRNMQLEHTDRSFDLLCPAIPQKHRKLRSEVDVLKGP